MAKSDLHSRISAIRNSKSEIRNPQSVQFVDITRYTGLGSFKHYTGTRGLMTILETTGSGIAFCDYDDDGYLDVYIANGSDIWGLISNGDDPRNALFRNNRDGTFTDVTLRSNAGDPGYCWGVVFADYDNDGDEDFYVTNFKRNALYRNDGDGTFAEVTDEAGVGDTRNGAGCAFADYDNDGDLDLYVVNYCDYELDKLPQYCMVDQTVKTGCPPWHYKGQPDVLYRNNGDGTFTDVTKEAGVYIDPGRNHGLGVIFGDYDNDNDQDIYVSNDSDPNFLYENNGDGSFKDVAMWSGTALLPDGNASAGMGVAWGDYNNDGLMDIFVTNYQDSINSLYQNLGNGLFDDVTSASGLARPSWNFLAFGAGFLDYDNDGDLDIFIANGHVWNNIEMWQDSATYEQANQLFENNGDGTFDEASASSGRGLQKRSVSRGAAFGDYDNDGDTDIVVTNSDRNPTLLRNEGGSQNDFLMVKVIGVKSNRNGVGVRVRAVCGDTSQIRGVRSGGSYMSSNDLRALFGFGQHNKVDTLELRWPSGVVQQFKNVEMNQLIVVEELSGIREGRSLK